MKKYPFSKKAIKAVLAATVAFTPVVATVGYSTGVVHAETQDDLTVYANKMIKFYRNGNFRGLTVTTPSQSQILSNARSLGLNLDQDKEAAFVQLIQDLSTLVYTDYGSNVSLLKQKIEDFKNNDTTEFTTLFNQDGQITMNELLSFLGDFDTQLRINIGLETVLHTNSHLSYSELISDTVTDVIGSYSDLEGKLRSIGLSMQKIFELQSTLNNIIDPITMSGSNMDHNFRSQMMSSAFQEMESNITYDADKKFTLNVLFQETPIPLQKQIGWDTSDHQIASFASNSNQLSVNGTGTVTVFAKIDNIVIAKIENISVVNGGGGGVGGGGSTNPQPPVVVPPGQVTLPPGATEVKKETNPATGKVEVVTKVSKDKVKDIVDQITDKVTSIPVKLDKPAAGEQSKAEVPGTLFKQAADKNSKAVVLIQSDTASYGLPAKEVDLGKFAKQLGAQEDELSVSVSINEVDKKDAQGAIDQNNLNVVSPIVDFSISVSGNNKTVELSTFNSYVERTLSLPSNVDSRHTVGVMINADGTVAPVPTEFVTIEGKQVAVLKSLHNSRYTVVKHDVTFPDVDNNKNWAEQYIETLASKYIIKGKDSGDYAPREDMTRAEFMILLVRALGLPSTEKYDGQFSDVKGDEWFNAHGELMAAVKYGIIKGKLDGRFAPQEKISRVQAAVMFQRALETGFLNLDENKVDKTKHATDFPDVKKSMDKLGWAYDGIEAVYQAGIFTGKIDGTFDFNGYMKRDQMAKALGEFLISAKLMADIEGK
ncbi:S-layer homology domain-containing protein [Falsibacillus pallidus]|uniref:S-layer homology domain-containing protein n=1 Tax=Falsibacillus pallidus TaxID=493781 RepID=UPI003D95F7A8